MVVQHNLSAMNANRMLGITQGTLSKSTEKLSSGYKINRAADDAAGLSISEKMRKQIRGLTQASLNAEDGISAVQTAEGALSEVQDMLQRMNELAVKGSNGTLSESDRQDIQNEIDNLVTEIDRVSETTKFNETYLLKGDNTVDNKVTYDYTQKLYLADKTLYDANGTEVAKGTVLDNNATYYTSRTATGKEALTLQADKDNPLLTATKVSFDKDVYSRDEDGNVTFIASGKAVNVGTTIYGNAVDASKNENGYTIDAAHITDAIEQTPAAIDSNTLQDAAGTNLSPKATVVESKASINLYTVDANGVETVIKAGDSFEVANAANIFKAVQYTPTAGTEVTSDEFGAYATDSQLMDKDGNEVAANGLYSYFDENGTYKGGLYKYADSENPSIKNLTEMSAAEVNLMVEKTEKETGALTLTLHVGADATKNNQISVDIDAMSASSLGIEGLEMTGKDDTKALNAIETIKAALQQVSEQRSALGAVQNRLEHTIKNLDNVVENTTAAESQIRDTDMASEMVKYSNANILSQAGQSMLAQANQSNQGVLSILG
ncbi:MAG: flagellar hook protein [Lachnospiraceae bacterium]|nr:flagellar hook protein [Lachnospiraceae bacterium]